MADSDPQDLADDAPRRTGEWSRSCSDSRRATESRDTRGSPPASESKYDAAAAGRPRTGPLRVKIEFVVVNGPAAEELIKRQAAAVRDALQWFADHPPEDASA
jgi:hypothetical protein